LDDPLWSQLLIQVILILINAFFACSEIAFLSLNEAKVRHAAEEGDKRSRKILKLLSDSSGFLSTIQVGITLAGFLGSAFAADSFASRISGGLSALTGLPEAAMHTISVVLVTLILSYFTLVLGELVPKRLAMKKPEAVANFACGVISCIALLMKPVVWFLSKSTNLVLRLFGIDPNADEETVTEEEIMIMVDEGEEKGTINADERDMIENIFDFSDLKASDVMTHRTELTALPADADESLILKTVSDSGFSRIPVYEGDIDNIIGIFNTKRYLIDRENGQKGVSLASMLQSPLLAPESVGAGELFKRMQMAKTHISVIIDEYGGTAGIVTMEDLLERIVGNIYDEFDDEPDEKEITVLGDNLWQVLGTTSLDILRDELSLDFGDTEAETLSGYILSRLNVIPEEGTTPSVEADGLRITACAVADRRIEKAVIEKLPAEQTDDVRGKDD